jgi:SAM-dependent methyltransferase
LALEPDVRVLDIACGTGNVTLPLARRGTTVTGLDMTPHLLEEARARAACEGLNIRFDEGFAEALPYPDASFDIVVSMFGIMFSTWDQQCGSTNSTKRLCTGWHGHLVWMTGMAASQHNLPMPSRRHDRVSIEMETRSCLKKSSFP